MPSHIYMRLGAYQAASLVQGPERPAAVLRLPDICLSPTSHEVTYAGHEGDRDPSDELRR